jgi:aminopeptidase-like protein
MTPSGLQGAYDVLRDCLFVLEHNDVLRTTCCCEPQLGRRGLYPTTSQRGSAQGRVRDMMNLLAYADGTRDLIGLAETIGLAAWHCVPIIETLEQAGLLEARPARASRAPMEIDS